MLPLTHPTNGPSAQVLVSVGCEECWGDSYLLPPRYLFLTHHKEMSPLESSIWTLKNFQFPCSPMKLQVSPATITWKVQLKGTEFPGTTAWGCGLGTDEGEGEGEEQSSTVGKAPEPSCPGCPGSFCLSQPAGSSTPPHRHWMSSM